MYSFIAIALRGMRTWGVFKAYSGYTSTQFSTSVLKSLAPKSRKCIVLTDFSKLGVFGSFAPHALRLLLERTTSMMMSGFSLLPKDDAFFQIFQQASLYNHKLWQALMSPQDAALSEEEHTQLLLAKLEDLLLHQDQFLSEAYHQLAAAFVTPFEREDILCVLESLRHMSLFAYREGVTLSRAFLEASQQDHEAWQLIFKTCDGLFQKLGHLTGATAFTEETLLLMGHVQHLELTRPKTTQVQEALSLYRGMAGQLLKLVLKHL